MNAPVPLDQFERSLMVSGACSIRKLGEQFGCSRTTISRIQRQIRAGQPAVYVFVPQHLRYPPKRMRRHFRSTDKAMPRELIESPLGVNPALACEMHLGDLQKWHSSPWPSLRMRTAVFAPLRVHKL